MLALKGLHMFGFCFLFAKVLEIVHAALSELDLGKLRCFTIRKVMEIRNEEAWTSPSCRLSEWQCCAVSVPH